MPGTGEFPFYTRCNVLVPKTQQNVLPGVGGKKLLRHGPQAAGAEGGGGEGGLGGDRSRPLQHRTRGAACPNTRKTLQWQKHLAATRLNNSVKSLPQGKCRVARELFLPFQFSNLDQFEFFTLAIVSLLQESLLLLITT